jgi:hypothetical protein
MFKFTNVQAYQLLLSSRPVNTSKLCAVDGYNRRNENRTHSELHWCCRLFHKPSKTFLYFFCTKFAQ